MFYSPAILAKKGELSKIWLAAHWQHRLSKQQAMSVDIAESCESIKQPSVPLSLRLSGQLLYGVARIHQKKVTYLSEDCSDALLKIKMAFRPGVVNLSAQDAAATPSKINAPAMSAHDDDIQSPAPRTASKNKFHGVEPKLDEDDWTNLTPVHNRRSLTRPTPTIDDSDARSTTTMDEKEEQWLEFPFLPTDQSSVEVVRKADDTRSDIASEQQRSNAEYKPYDYEEANALGDEDFGPSGSGVDFAAQQFAASGAEDDGLMLNQSWVEDVAMRENEENENTASQKSETKKKKKEKEKKQAPASAPRRRKKLEAVTELSNEQIQAALQDVSDITAERMNPRERTEHEDSLRAKGFPVYFSQTGFENGLETPATLGLHPRLVQMFRQNAKAVPSFSGEKETSIEEEDVEVVRAATTVMSGNLDVSAVQGMDEPYDYDVGGGEGDDSFQPSNIVGEPELTAEVPGELELTFQDPTAAGESPTRGPRTSATPTSARRSTVSQVGVGEGEKWNPQTVNMMKLLREKLSDTETFTYQELAEGEKRTIVAKAFFEILTLTTRDMISVSQSQPFGEIQISAGKKYETLLPGE